MTALTDDAVPPAEVAELSFGGAALGNPFAAAWRYGWQISLVAGARETRVGCPFLSPASSWHRSPLKSLAPGS